MTRANVSGDCLMITNSEVQASTHNRANTPNTASNFLAELRFESEGIGRDKFREVVPTRVTRL